MAEPVRLVVWDRDETFWSGTLSEGGTRTPVSQFARPNQWARSVAQRYSNISVVASRDFILGREDLRMHHGRHDIVHYDRQVYFRIYEHLASL